MCGHYCSACCQATEPLGLKSRHCSVCCKNSAGNERCRKATSEAKFIKQEEHNTAILTAEEKQHHVSELKAMTPILMGAFSWVSRILGKIGVYSIAGFA